jgi:hypothetical protein
MNPIEKSPDDGKKHVDFDNVMLDKCPVTYERNLIAALIHSHKVFLATNGYLCPWDGTRGVRRPDFSVNHYNIVYEAISTFWGQIGTETVVNDPIPQSQLKATLIDWNNTHRVATDIIEKILVEIDEDLYNMDLTEDVIDHGIMGKAFSHWLDTRLSKRLVDHLSSTARERTLTLEECQQVFEQCRAVQLSAENALGKGNPPHDRNMWDLSNSVDAKNDPDELLKTRYLGRSGGLLMVGPTGIGKSTIAMQCLLLWGLNRPAFGIQPNGNLKSLIIQAENDDVDMAEMFNGVCEALELNGTERENGGKQIVAVREDATSGSDFFLKVVRPMLAKHKPDLLLIDPALAYLGGESKSQRDVGHFLRTLLNPLIREFNCGAIVLHHTNKPPSGKDASTWSGNDYAYSGGGSAEWANWARAVLVLKPIKDSPVFELMAAKRGARIGWRAGDGETRVYSKFIAHSKVPGQLFWRDVLPSEMPVAGDSKVTDEAIILDLVPPEGDIPKNQLFEDCDNNGLPVKRARDAIKRLLAANKLKEGEIPRTIGPGEKRISLVAVMSPQPPKETSADKKEEPAGVIVTGDSIGKQQAEKTAAAVPPPPSL